MQAQEQLLQLGQQIDLQHRQQAQEPLLQLGQQFDLQHWRQAQDYTQRLGRQINEQVAVDLRNQLNSVRSHPLAQASRGGGAGEGRMADSDSDDISDTAEALVFWGDGPPEGVLLREPDAAREQAMEDSETEAAREQEYEEDIETEAAREQEYEEYDGGGHRDSVAQATEMIEKEMKKTVTFTI